LASITGPAAAAATAAAAPAAWAGRNRARTGGRRA
jgi:hypothetical protein